MNKKEDFICTTGITPRKWTDEELSAYKQYALAHYNSRTPEQNAKLRELSEKYRKELENIKTVFIKQPDR